jgi:hypothetical protein
MPSVLWISPKLSYGSVADGGQQPSLYVDWTQPILGENCLPALYIVHSPYAR